MKRMLVLFAVLAVCASSVQAQELLSNGDLNIIVQNPPGSEAIYYPEIDDWDMVTNPCTYFPCVPAPYVPGAFYTPYSGYPASFADRLNPNNPDPNEVDYGLIGEAYQGHYPGEIIGTVSIEIHQEVAATPGEIYRFSGWAHFEGGYAGGVEFLALDSPNQRNQDAQVSNPGVPVAALTDTIFALEFLDGLGTVLPNSIVWELHDDGGQQNDDQSDGRDWMKHTLVARAPDDAVTVRVRAGMIDGEFNFDPPGQSQNVFMDDFSLTLLPEPTTGVMALMGLVAACGRRRFR